jgi:hypothetical protein
MKDYDLGPLYLPWEPLERWLYTVVRPTHGGTSVGWTYGDSSRVVPTDLELADAIGLHPARLYHFRKHGEITVQAADKICARMGVHISFVYGQAYWDYLDARIEFDEARRKRKNEQRVATNARMVAARSQRRAEVRASCA